MTATNPITQAEFDGADARRLGVPIEHNPHEAGSREYDAWELGWQREDRKATPA